jgi:hypothetical protein
MALPPRRRITFICLRLRHFTPPMPRQPPLSALSLHSPMPHSLRLGQIPRLLILSPPIFEPVFAASRFRHRLSPPPVHATPPAAATADAATLPLMPPFSHAFHASRHISPPLAAAGRFSRQIFATFSLIFAADSCC